MCVFLYECVYELRLMHRWNCTHISHKRMGIICDFYIAFFFHIHFVDVNLKLQHEHNYNIQ